MGKRPTDIARLARVNEGYLSELINGKKTDPSTRVLGRIAKAIGVHVALLFRPPPSPQAIRELSGLDPSVLFQLDLTRR